MDDNKEPGAKPLSNAWFSPGIIDASETMEAEYHKTVEETGHQILGDLAVFLMLLVNSKNDGAIGSLRTCAEGLFKRAFHYRKENRDWTIDDEIDE